MILNENYTNMKGEVGTINKNQCKIKNDIAEINKYSGGNQLEARSLGLNEWIVRQGRKTTSSQSSKWEKKI